MDTTSAIKQLTDALRNDPDSFIDTFQRNFKRIKSATHRSRPFIVRPNQLDCTQPEDYGYGTDEWRERRKKVKEIYNTTPAYKEDVKFRLSYGKNLRIAVVGYPVKRSKLNPFGIIPEVAESGQRRCTFVRNNGMRCRKYDQFPVCPYHIHLVQAIPYMNDQFAGVIKSEPLMKVFEKHISDPNRRTIEGEVALMRTMLDVVLSRIQASTDLSNIPPAEISAVMNCAKLISETVERMVVIENKLGMRLGLDQVMSLISKVVQLVIETCQPTESQCAILADGITKLQVLNTIGPKNLAQARKYGMDAANDIKLTSPTTKYLEDGTVQPNGFTEEEITKDRAEMVAHFAPRTEAYKNKKAAMSKIEDFLGQNRTDA